MMVTLMYFEVTGRPPERVGLNDPTIAPYGVYPCGDSASTLMSIQNGREWVRFYSEVLQAPGMACDVRFRTNEDRVGRRADLDRLMVEIFGRLDLSECRRRLDSAGIAYGLLNSVREFASHPHLRRIPIETTGGPVQVVAPADRTRHVAGRRVPGNGEQTAQLRAEFP